MKERELYTILSLELHLHFLRIMRKYVNFPADSLLLHASRLSKGIIRPELPAAYHFNSKYCDTDNITLELSQTVKHLNQAALIYLHQYINSIKDKADIPQEAQCYYDYLLKLENEKTSDILSQEF